MSSPGRGWTQDGGERVTHTLPCFLHLPLHPAQDEFAIPLDEVTEARLEAAAAAMGAAIAETMGSPEGCGAAAAPPTSEAAAARALQLGPDAAEIEAEVHERLQARGGGGEAPAAAAASAAPPPFPLDESRPQVQPGVPAPPPEVPPDTRSELITARGEVPRVVEPEHRAAEESLMEVYRGTQVGCSARAGAGVHGVVKTGFSVKGGLAARLGIGTAGRGALVVARSVSGPASVPRSSNFCTTCRRRPVWAPRLRRPSPGRHRCR
jgi:hypothetical protein